MEEIRKSENSECSQLYTKTEYFANTRLRNILSIHGLLWFKSFTINGICMTLHHQSPAERVDDFCRRLKERATRPDISIGNFLPPLENFLSNPYNAIENPLPMVKTRGRPAAAKNKSKRDKSQFEIVEGRKCSKCKLPGHNARTCNKRRVMVCH
ncbi:hypothetical protein BC833DRAFT_613744 [Globomyces pollinis-pini]|nr:hypothetical protein BC833DRAFT_613744 [Globomyces pollinis-pini]